jgi:Protein of unknown function (DUF2934)
MTKTKITKPDQRLDLSAATELQSDIGPRGRKRGHRPASLPEHSEKIIRRRAYELYEKRGRQDGHAEEDWLRAEAEVLGTLLRRGNRIEF